MKDKYGLVLAGGGSKGAYQIGAWKAMLEMKLSFEAIAGVSIGSVNGALIAMKDYDNAVNFWNSISVDKGVKIEEKLVDPDNLFSRKNWPALFREVIKNKGIDASPAKDFFLEYIDEAKVRKSKINFGLVTIKLASDGAKPLEILLKDIPKGQLIDYLLASADIPLAINIGPDGERFLDGGTYDNTPIAFLKKNGYNRLVVVDIANIKGFAHTMDNHNTEIVYIRPYNLDDLGASFDFSAQMNATRMQMGYLDAKKAFSKLLGNIFYFEVSTFRNMVKKYGADALKQLEELAYKLKMERLKIYTEEEFISELKSLYHEHQKELEEEKAKKKAKAEKKEEGEKKGYFSELYEKFTQSKSDDDNSKKGYFTDLLEKMAQSSNDEDDTARKFSWSSLSRMALDFMDNFDEESFSEDFEEKKKALYSMYDLVTKRYKSEKNFDLAEEILNK